MVLFLAYIPGSIFCVTPGILSLGIIAFAVKHILEALDRSKNERLIHIFDAVGLVASAVAVLNLVLTIVREIILRKAEKSHPSYLRKSLTRFGAIISIAILIEGFIMIFRYSKAGQTQNLPCTALVLAGVTIPAERILDAEITQKG
jgi:uncharacterized BrkB/YihY/UPF0761 family membrane protein